MIQAQAISYAQGPKPVALQLARARAEFEPLAADVLRCRAACEVPGLKGAERDRAWEARNEAERLIVFAVRRYPRAKWVELMALAESLCNFDEAR